MVPSQDGFRRRSEPFLDPVVTNFALTLPTRHKVRGLRKKVLLPSAGEPLVPGRIVRGRKRGLSIPAPGPLREPRPTEVDAATG